MEQKKIIILGAGFSGITVARTLTANKNKLSDYRIILIDKKSRFEFLPIIADILAGWLKPSRAYASIHSISDKLGVEYINAEVKDVDSEKKEIILGQTRLSYDYLVVATGGVPIFFGNKTAAANCYRFNSVDDVLRLRGEILQQLQQKEPIRLVIIGGGYTGLEIATNAHFLLKQKHSYDNFEITVVEKAPDVLMMVPQYLRAKVKRILNRLKIKVITGDSLAKYENGTVILKSGYQIKKAICAWSAGVKPASCLDKIDAPRIKGRIKVNHCLQVENKNCQDLFVIGDSAAFIDQHANEPLRMAVMFSLAQGKITAKNIINAIYRLPLMAYKPKDLGFLLPLTYYQAPGIILGKSVAGFIGYFLHYFMCVYRSEPENRLGLLKDLIRGRMVGLNRGGSNAGS